VPLPEVARLDAVDGAPQGRPHAIGRDRVASSDVADALDAQQHAVGFDADRLEAVAVGDLHARGTRDIDECGVELDAGNDRGVGPATARERERDLAARWASHHDVVHDLPRAQPVG
jgi:hypothetical protein